MNLWTVLAGAAFAVPTTALACSCVYSENPDELRALAKDAIPNAVALVEAETIQTYAESQGAGDRIRIIKTLAGSASGEFRVERGSFPSSASCDQLYEKGQRAVMILYKPAQAAGDGPKYRISGLCTAGLLDQAPFRDEVARLMGSKASAERG
jgi:hypothetical protein